MPLFFLAGGYVYKKKSILDDLKRRFTSLIIPYVLFVSVTLIYWQLIEKRFRKITDIHFSTALLGFLKGQVNTLEFNIYLWFLQCFFLTVVLFNIIVNAFGKKSVYMISIAMSGIWIILDFPRLWWGIDRVFEFIFFYAMGTFLFDINIKDTGRLHNISI